MSTTGISGISPSTNQILSDLLTTPYDIRQGLEEQLDESKRYDFFTAAGLNYITAVGLLIEDGEASGYPPCTLRTVAAAVSLMDPAQLLPHIAGNSSARAVVAPLVYSFQSGAAGATEQLNGIVREARELVSPLLTGCELEAQQQVAQHITAMLNATSLATK
jgi:hypothetical protein